MDKFAYISYIIDNLSRTFNKPIRVSYYETYCDIFVIGNKNRYHHVEYSVINRMFKTNDETCNICYENINQDDVACFNCGNIICNMCFINLICVNYIRGIYVCPYCKCERKFKNIPNEAEKHILEILQYLNIRYNRIKLVIKAMKETYPLLFTN
jgi:hypothetical protein